jgi:hypothetical protein
MNWEAIGAIGELVAAAAVFASLVYLATQIRDSKRSDQIVAASQAASAVDEWIGQIVRDGELYDLYRRGLSEYESLSREEKGRFALLIMQFLRSVETVWIHKKMGAIDPSYWMTIELSIKAVIGSVGGTRAFDRQRDVISPEFASLIDEILPQTESKESTNLPADAS